MNTHRTRAERHCQALAEIHATCKDFLTDDQEIESDETARVVGQLWDNITAIVFDTYFTAIEATPEERAELGL